MAQPETRGVKTSDGESAKFETLSDDEEITIPSQDIDRKIADVRNIDISDEQLEKNTQREDWLLPTEPMHRARPRQTGGERPPATENPVFRDAAEISAVQHSSRTLRLSPGRRIFMEEEVCTPPRGGRPAPEPQGVPREVRAVPQIFLNDSLRDDGQGQRNFRSPVEMLVNTVSHMQEDLAILREENRILRTPATSQVTQLQAPRWAALTTTKVLQFDGTTS